MKIGIAIRACHDGLGFRVSIENSTCRIETTTLSTVIGWARKSQNRQCLTPFAISNALEGLYFEPATPASLEILQKDLIVLLENIGFDTNELTFTEETTPHLRRPPPQPIQVAATEQPLNA